MSRKEQTKKTARRRRSLKLHDDSGQLLPAANLRIFATMLHPDAPKVRSRLLESILAAHSAGDDQIIGALLDAVSYGLRRLPETQLMSLPRMADFAL